MRDPSIHDGFAEKYCFDPPEPAWGGGYDWDNVTYFGGFTPYETEVTYSCDHGRRFVRYHDNGTSFAYDNKTIVCHWNATWMPEGLVSRELLFTGWFHESGSSFDVKESLNICFCSRTG